MSPKHTAEVFRAIGVVGRSPPSPVVRLRDLLRPHLLLAIPHMGALQLRHVAWTINRLSIPWLTEIESAVKTIVDRVGLVSVGSDELATFVWAVSRIGACNSHFAGLVAVDWKGRVGRSGMSPEAHAVVLTSLGASARDHPDVVRLFSTCSSELPFESFNPTELASVLWAFGHVPTASLDPSMWKVYISKFGDTSTIQQCPLKSIGNAFWAAGTIAQYNKCESHPPLSFIRHLGELLVRSELGPFTGAVTSSVAWAVTLANDDGPWVQQVFRSLLQNDHGLIEKGVVEEWKPLELATVLSSLADAKLLDSFEDFTKLTIEVVIDTITTWRPTAQNVLAVSQISNALWSSGQEAVLPIVEWAVTNGDALTPQSESRILWAAAKMFESSALREPPPSVVAFVNGLVDRYRSREHHQYQQQDVGLLVWALGTLRLSHYELEERCCVLARGMLKEGRIDSRHLAMVLWGITSNAHRSPSAIDLIKDVVDRVESSTLSPRPADVTIVIWSMAVFDLYSEEALQKLLEALVKAGPMSNAPPRTEQGASLIRLHRSLLWARLCHGFQPSPSEEAHVVKIAQRQRAPGGGLVTSSTLQWEIRSELQRVLLEVAPTASLRDEYELPAPLEGIFVDLAVIDAKEQVLLIIEVDGYSHFSKLIGDNRLAVLQYNGNTELSRRILRKAGYEVLSISTVDWNNTQRHRRGEYLREQLRHVIA
ncbi:hypothetical protein Pmar_PMAR007492 [Perkinsus marinus ATCC 50983]|uniref:RAP domain-containing protein n=1 Tax=Perkinsus marinus (strain ATCC 50983 / TXsc) TaxID=423536 RepID=C5M064_PERM5|nr:hypothetical protein Pmar_PMAR007492 [Perkinsus marinus ATCC 50983]EEQ97642.1 hypothetical protein Pmar_PMAR007492 [Perkinsus marinus ATCC 50983]|eukprot:XP_002764925.1 hypothetical protein Pmar_PMAR007492 [Perkinsus marinus ATCC 50983]